MFDITEIRKEFPILKRKINDHPLVYFDNAATSQKPQSVIDAVSDFYENHNANIHRGIHTLSEEATTMYEESRKTVQQFIQAQSPEEIVFTNNTTDGINTVLQSLSSSSLLQGKVILVSDMEHHSNLLPYQQLVAQKGMELKYIPLTKDFIIDLEVLEKLLKNNDVALVACTHISNVLGSINPAKDIVRLSHQYKALCLIDTAQSVPHIPIDVQKMDVDFLVFSGHKMCGPSGVGVLYGKKVMLTKLQPTDFGGGMIHSVSKDETKWAPIPHRFEAGTPNIEGVIGLKAAIEFLQSIGMSEILRYEKKLIAYMAKKISHIETLHLFGPRKLSQRGGVFSFSIDSVHPHDIAEILNNSGIAIRAGHHCAQPLHHELHLPATARASLYFYNTTDEIDFFIQELTKIPQMFA